MKRELLLAFLIIFLLMGNHLSSDDTPVKDHPPELGNENPAGEDDGSFIHNLKVRIVNYVIQENFPREFDFDEMNINILSGVGAEFHNLRIAENPDFGTGDFMTTEYVNIRMKFLPLLIGNMNIIEMVIKDPSITMRRNRKGELSIVDLMKSVEEKKAMIEWMEVAMLSFQGGRIKFIDQSAPGGEVILDMDSFKMTLKDFSLDKLASINMEGRVPGSGGINFKMSGKIGPMTSDLNLNEISVDVSMIMGEISLDPYINYVPTGLPFRPVSCLTSMEYHVRGTMASEMAVKGNMKFRDLVMENLFDKTLSKKIAMRIDINDSAKFIYEKGIFQSDSMKVYMNDHEYLVKGRVESLYNKPEWDIKITSGNISYDELRSIYPGMYKIIPEKVKFSGYMDMVLESTGNLDDMTGIMNIDMSKMRILVLDAFEKKRNFPGSVLIRGEKDSKNNIKADGNFRFDEIEIKSESLAFSLDKVFDELVKMEKMSAYKENLKREIESFKKDLLKKKRIEFKDIKGKYYAKSAGLDYDSVKLADVSMLGPEGSFSEVYGSISLRRKKADLKSVLYFPAELSKRLAKAAPPLKKLMNARGQIVLHVGISGDVNDADYKVESKLTDGAGR